jgi:hypothetical protein
MLRRMKYAYYIFVVRLCIASAMLDGGVFIIVHGTWSKAASWYAPGGHFFDLIEQKARDLGHTAITYTWSGYLDEAHRAAAGKALAKLIRSYPADTEFYIIAHSHGGNVAILASQELGTIENNKHRIKIVYALATPVDPTHYMPDMNVIDYFYNLFSFKDAVQPVMGFFSRTYPDHERIANIRIMINGKEPYHCDIHHQTLAQWLPQLHEMLIKNECSPLFALYTPGLIHFRDQSKPQYLLDIEREELLTKDKSLYDRVCAVFRKRMIEEGYDYTDCDSGA